MPAYGGVQELGLLQTPQVCTSSCARAENCVFQQLLLYDLHTHPRMRLQQAQPSITMLSVFSLSLNCFAPHSHANTRWVEQLLL